MLALLDLCDGIETGDKIDSRKSKRKVLGIDIDIRTHNRIAIEAHPMSSRIQMLQGSSIDLEIIEHVKKIAAKYNRIMVCLDSNHTYDHVMKELAAYAPLVSLGSYCVVFDTVIDQLPKKLFEDRPWCSGNSPMTAVNEFLQKNKNFKACSMIDQKLQISASPNGYLIRTE
jgi:cephalosporin hydroxylase